MSIPAQQAPGPVPVVVVEVVEDVVVEVGSLKHNEQSDPPLPQGHPPLYPKVLQVSEEFIFCTQAH